MRLSICILLVFAITKAFCQTEKGKFSASASILYGGVTITLREIDYDNSDPRMEHVRNINLAFTPAVGKFITEDLLVGTGINFALASVRRTSANPFSMAEENRSMTIALAPYGQYFLGENKSARPFVQASPTIGVTNNRIIGDYYTSKTSTFSFGGSVSGGYAVFLNDSFFLSFFLTYSYTHGGSQNKYSTNYNTFDTEKINRHALYLGVSLNNMFKRK